jgi:branched-subunit amino acid aminotransferase/4-amino-4-deoxychorismate lyase
MSHLQSGCICVNGCFFEPADATVSALDAGFLLGDGLFESLRAMDGVPYLLDRHLMRLFVAAEEMDFVNMPSRETITEQVYRVLHRSSLADAYLRVTITRGVGAVGLALPDGAPTVVVAALPAPARHAADSGIYLTSLQRRSGLSTTAKSTSWQHAVLARRRVAQFGADEGLYVSEHQHVLECVSSNIFAVSGNILLTPRDAECLPGITRARVLELARGHGLTVIESQLELAELMDADEIFVTNAVQGLRAVHILDGTAMPVGGPEGIFATLLDLYQEDRRAMVGVIR